ncbi:unnamed protein product [marine sediment metagenome]|uniref:Uncharacterized protein n=1 Tax=marine sediment metagenome TaxID=412755 RepID=X0ZH43_9ZZZZ
MLTILIFLVFFLTANIYTSINHLTVEKEVKRFGIENLYGFYSHEQENAIMYNWIRNEAVKIPRKKGDVVCITIGKNRPEIEYIYSFCYPYIKQKNGVMYSWTRNEAVKILRKKGDVVCIPIGNNRPEIEENNVNLKITINDKMKYSYTMNSNDWKLVLINVKGIKDDYIKIKFDVDKTWRPIDLLEDSIDERILGVKVGEIYWE